MLISKVTSGLTILFYEPSHQIHVPQYHPLIVMCCSIARHTPNITGSHMVLEGSCSHITGTWCGLWCLCQVSLCIKCTDNFVVFSSVQHDKGETSFFFCLMMTFRFSSNRKSLGQSHDQKAKDVQYSGVLLQFNFSVLSVFVHDYDFF